MKEPRVMEFLDKLQKMSKEYGIDDFMFLTIYEDMGETKANFTAAATTNPQVAARVLCQQMEVMILNMLRQYNGLTPEMAAGATHALIDVAYEEVKGQQELRSILSSVNTMPEA